MKEREREREQRPSGEQPNWYETIFADAERRRKRAEEGRIVSKATDIPWQYNRQGPARYYVDPDMPDVAVNDWLVFWRHFETKSGRHTHQGGIVLYIVHGRGYTVADGEKREWKAGDVVLLPVLPGGVEHQHFNEDPDNPSAFVGFVYRPWQLATGAMFSQNETDPNWEDAR